MTEISHRYIETNGIRMHIAEAGPTDGPAVIMLHGFPETWYSWRHQLRALGEAGYHAIAPDMRGMGRTTKPASAREFTQPRLVGDIVGLLDALRCDRVRSWHHAPLGGSRRRSRLYRFPATVRQLMRQAAAA